MTTEQRILQGEIVKILGWHRYRGHWENDESYDMTDTLKEIEAFILSKVREAREEILRKVENYTLHQRDCILSEWSGGRPTKEGGYESLFGDKWYPSKPIDKTPKCTCELDDLLAKLSTLR